MIERKRLFHQAQTHKIMDTKGQAFVQGSQIRPLPQDGKVSEITLKSHLLIMTLLLNQLWIKDIHARPISHTTSAVTLA